jgi:hypothetical protein
VGVGCFYDSSWGARKAAEAHNAARARPAALASATPAAADAVATSLKVRVHATPAYVAQTPDWKIHAGTLLEDASATLRSSLGVNLVLVSAETWDAPVHSHLAGDLAALHDEDSGDGADLVLGLVGALSIATSDFDQVGLAILGGKHLVVRAPNVANEYEAVEKAFDELREEDRARLRRERLHHREVAVLLHEIGHALGAAHDDAAGSLMRPAYDAKMAGFDDASIAAMHEGLSRKARGESDTKTVAKVGPSPQPPVEAPAKDDAPSDLRAEDRDVWREACAKAKAGDAEGAWRTAKPLFNAYPRAYAVQDLRCKLAMAYLGSYDAVRAECDALLGLAMKGAKPKPSR